MLENASPELRDQYVISLAELDQLFSQECRRETIGFFPTYRVWVCPYCESTIPDTGIPTPLDMSHRLDCEWMMQLNAWPKELVEYYIAAWMQRNPQSKRIIRAGFTMPLPAGPDSH